ncbi:MFS transporter [Corynebacterium accolens]|uniref:MFS transporter n=1 Tax=Corynebacterium accolens TaxID=38284 RepID=UPI00266FD1C4|nr:MFS transporter [Corynebacterium accolens]WKS65281.1 MFS transporter [Corynebacterium accolens]
MKIIDQLSPRSAHEHRIHRRPLPRQTEISTARRTIVMVAMALGAFAIGTTEFVSMGLLPLIAEDFGVSEDTASTLITTYALGVVVGAPLIAAFTGKLPRRRLILLLIGFLVVGNLLSVLAPNYWVLMVARFIAGMPHGAYFSVANLSAASMAPPGGRGKAMAFVGMGLAIATVIGVPAAQALGSALGWHAAYLVVVVIGLITAVALFFLMPHMTEMKQTDIRTEFGAFKNSQVWLTVIMGVVGFGGMFSVYTYISWTMTEVAGLSDSLIWVVLMAYGIGMTIGNAFGGWLADRNLEFGIIFALASLIIILTAFYFLSSHAIAATICFGMVAFMGSTLVPSLQLRLVHVAGDAQTLSAALNQSALNIANAAGATIGGIVVGAGLGYSAPALAGAGLAAAGCVVWAITMWDKNALPIVARTTTAHAYILEHHEPYHR